MIYKVMVDDNYDYMDTEKRYIQGEYGTLDAAIEACKKIVDEWLESAYQPGMGAEELCSSYKNFGLDPWISGIEKNIFSAWEYAEKRCAEICTKGR